jgi:VanZ family protein
VSRRSSYLLLLFVVAALLLFVPLPIPPTYAGRTIENAGHTPLFFIVTLAAVFMLRDRPRFAGWRLYLAAGAIGIGLGLLSEVVQRPLARDASWEDVGADAIGAIWALAAYALFDRFAGIRRWHRVIALAVVASCLLVYLSPIYTMTRAYLHRNGQFPVLASFHSRTELYWTLSIGVYREIVNDALEVIFVARETPGIGFHEPVPDWTGFGWLVLDVENPANEPLKLGVRVHDKSHNWQYHDRFNREFDLAAGERRSIRISLDDIRRGPRKRPMDMTRISNISLFRGATTGSRHLRIHTIRLE